MIAQSCLTRRVAQSCSRTVPSIGALARRHFHPTLRRGDGMPDHYATLNISTTATAGEIKKQFYKLSKANHPDLNPNDASASQRFVKISEAHATLGSPEKKARYDRDFLRTQAPPSASGQPGGSYSSLYAGSRPASGLSKRRTTFRGPPPSFYRSGGWGEHSEKRAEHAAKASHSHEAQGQASSGPAGTGPGGFATGFDNDVRHFDQQGHYRTHSEIERSRHRARRRQTRTVAEEDIDYSGGSGMFFNFFMVSGVLVLTFVGSAAIWGAGSREERRRTRDSRV